MGSALVIGSCSGNFRVLDHNSGELLWEYDIHQDGKQTSFHGDPLVTADRLVIVGTDLSCAPDGIGYVYAFDVKNKTVKWKQKFPSGISTPIVESGNALFFGGAHGAWYRADTRTGKVAWEYQVPESTECIIPRAPVIVGGRVFIVVQDGAIHVIDAVSGKLIQRIHPPSNSETALLRYNDQILFGAGDDSLYSLNPTTLDLTALIQFEGIPTGRLLLDHDRLFLFLREPEHQAAIMAYNLHSRKVEWMSRTAIDWSTDIPQLWNGLVLAGNCKGNLLALSAVTGEQVWSQQLTGCIRSIGTSDKILYLGAQDGQLYAFRPSVMPSVSH